MNCAIHQAHAHCADRAEERNVGDCERGRSAIDAGDVGIVFGVGGKNEGDDLSFTAEAFRKQEAAPGDQSGGW